VIDEMTLKKLHLRDPMPVRLGNLASSVKRLGFLIHSVKSEKTVHQLFHECKIFSMWTAPDASFEAKLELDTLLRDLENWEKNFKATSDSESWRTEVADACTRWSNRLLELSGLLKTGFPEAGR
jgi:hypothetical protein